MTPAHRALLAWIIVGAIGFFAVPWYAVEDSVLGVAWLRHWIGKDEGSAAVQVLVHGRIWLLPLLGVLIAASAGLAGGWDRRVRANVLVAAGTAGFAWLLAQGFAIGPTGGNFESLNQSLAPLVGRQYGMGAGPSLLAVAFVMIASLGLAARGHFKGDAFVAGSVVAVGVLIAVFTFFPVIKILIQAVQDNDG